MVEQASVILLSGGLDSAANLAFCAERNRPALALTCDYGQRAAAREIAAARSLCEYYDVRHEILDLRWLGRMGGSALTDAAQAVPEPEVSLLDDPLASARTAKAVWVPNRNGILLQAAAAYAERLGARRVLVGFNREEAQTFPDNSRGFLEAATAALRYSTANQVEIHSYTVAWDKREIVRELRKLARPFPFDRIWSCYHGGVGPCGACESCRRLARALEAA